MPNYRKYKQSQKIKRSKSKNKNSQQNKNESNAESSSVRQELSDEYESVGIEPNLLNSPDEAGVSLSCVDGGGAVFTSVQLDVEKGVIDDSSPSSNEEIDESACNVDIDTCSSDSKTVLTQSNYSSSFCCSSKESTEFERISKRTVFDGDSPVEIDVIRDLFKDGSGINSTKTGSTHSKDAVVSTAGTSASKSTGAVKKRKPRKDSPEGSHNEAGQSTEPSLGPSQDTPSMDQSSKVAVHRTAEETIEKSQEVKPGHSAPSLATSTKVIVHEITKECPPPIIESSVDGSRIFVQKVEESKTTSHTALKKETIQSTNTQPTPKKKAVRSSTKEIEHPAKVIVHQISREDDERQNKERRSSGQSPEVITQKILKKEDESLTKIANQEQTSKVIVHEISTTVSPQTMPYTETISKVIANTISKAADETLTRTAGTEESSKVIVHEISTAESSKTLPYTETISKVIVNPILKERDEILTRTGSTEQSSKVIVLEISKEPIESPTTARNVEQSSKVIVHQTLSEDNEPAANKSQSATEKVIVHQISSDNTSHLSGDTSAKVTFSRDLPTEEVKVIAHQITLAAQALGDSLQDAILVDEYPRDSSRVIYRQTESDSLEKYKNEKDSFVTEFKQQSATEQFKKSFDTEESLNDVQSTSPVAGESPKPSAESLHQARVPESSSERKQHESSSQIHSSVESTTQSFPALFPTSTANEENQPLDVYFERISRSRSPEPEKFTQASEPKQDSTLCTKVTVHPILQDKETQISPPQSPEIKTEHTILTNGLGHQSHSQPEPLQKTSFPVYRSPKVIVHQIHHEGPVKPVFPLTANSMEKLNHSSKQMAHQILQDVSSELKSTFSSDVRSRTTKEASNEPVRTSFPLAPLNDGQVRTSFSDFSALLAASTAETSSSSPKVIVHQISRQDQSEQEAGESKRVTEQETSQSSATSSQNQTRITTEPPQSSGESKVIVHQISREDQPPTTQTMTSDVRVTSSVSASTSETVSRDEVDSKSSQSIAESPGSKVIIHKIVREESADGPSNKFPKEKDNKHAPSVRTQGFPGTNFKPKAEPALSDLEEKLKVFKALQEELKLSAQLQQKVESRLGIQPDQVPPSSFPLSPSSSFPSVVPEESETRPALKQKTATKVSTLNQTTPLLIPTDNPAPKSPLTPEESTSSSSSGDTILTAIRMESPKLTSPPDTGEQEPVKIKSPRSSFFLTSLEMSNPSTPPKPDTPDSSDTETLHGESDIPADDPPEASQSLEVVQQQVLKAEIPKEPGKVIIHPILREMSSEKLAYRVESPQPEQRLALVRKSKSFDDDDVIIQEMSDASSAGDTDNPPVVSEAESETDTLEAIDDFPETPLNSRVLSVQTLPIDHEDDNQGQLSPKSSQNYKARRQLNRVALESHFLPQFLSPIFLDSIKEENSDLSDSERRSECSDRADHASSHQGDLEDDVFHEGGPPAKKADAVFPKSNLDFSKKHIHTHTNIRPPKASVIREEAPPPSVVEAKIIDQGSVEESCSSWSTDLTPESEAAEVVYIDSASSSVSDLLELDYSQGQPPESEDSLDVRIQTPTIDLESINEMFPRPNNERAEPPPPPPSPTLPPPVEENENIGEKIPSPSPSPALTPSADDLVTATTLSKTENTKTTLSTVEHTNSNEIILEKIETVSDTVAANDDDDDRDDRDDDRDAAAAASDRTQNSKANNPNSCDSAINEVAANATPDIAVGRSEQKMESIREIVSSSVKSELDTATDGGQGIPKPDFKIGEPCSDHTLKGDITNATSPSSTSSSTSTTTTTTSVTKVTTTSGTQILTLHDLRMNLGDTKHLHPLGGGSSALDRQESLDSHGSDHSQSTNQSQCTAINQGSLPNCEWNEFDTTTDTTYVSGSDTAGLASSENSSPITTGANRAGANTESPPIKKLRSLCTEALASMPYGEEVLEELATVAKNIGDMPYPLPELPHIQDIQVSLRSERFEPRPQTSSVITLTQMPPASTTSAGQRLRSPPPPPVPEPPSKYESWLGVPTESDPNVLVCLSPSQRAAVNDNTTPDSLLDMHKKFVERRGYHEFTTKQVKAMNDENAYETVTLRKSNSPPPPLPPRPQQSTPQAPQPTQSNGNGIQSEADIFADDQNNHRLLAIIRDTHDSQHQHQQLEQKSTTTSMSENISRRTESTSRTNTNDRPGNTTTATTPTADGGGREEFANQPSVSKQTQERFVSENNQSQSAQEKMQTEHTIKVESEPVMGLRFPTSDYFDSIFGGSGGSKRFSNIETGPSPGFCSQFLNTQPKRYSNIETSSFESRKCVENGKVLYDVTDRAHEKVVEGEKPDVSVGPTSFPEMKPTTNGFNSFPFNVGFTDKTDSRTQTGGSENIMSAFKLNTQTDTATAPPPPPPPAASSSTSRVEASPPAPPVPPLPANLADTTATTASTMKSTSTSESVINRNFNAETKETIFDEFRQRAKEAAGEQKSTGATTTTKSTSTTKSSAFDHEKVFKDFDELSKLLKDELESGKRRPPATLDTSQIPASVSDYNRVAAESRIQSNHVSSSSSEQTRRAQMKKLADEIDRTATQRQRQRQVTRIPITVEKPTPTPPRYPPEPSASSYEQATRSMENFKKWSQEADRVNLQTQRTHEIPIQVERESHARPTLQNQRSYEIPIKVEHQTGARQRTFSERRQSQGSHEAPQQTERPREESQRFRRAESMFNISDTTNQRHMLHDDWMKYVGDLGSSENICKPFQREVEICYLGHRPNIRAPRLSASTSDLSSSQCYDTYGAYDVRRTANNQTPRPQQPPRRFLSSQSMIDTTPITACVSSRRSPVPERRSSLPRELHDQQLKYISSREHQLQVEYERLENERRQLIDEMNRAQINQRISREAYRQRQLPPLTEDESFRQQMAEEWLDKVAQREERRLQKIIKISKLNQDENFPAAPPRRISSSDIGDEFLRRVKERRSKLCMPSDSDWESGAESQPAPRTDGNRSETEEPPVIVLEGQSTADLKQLPKHLREFAKLTSQVKEEHREETTENTSCSATKKSSVVTTVKTTNSQHSTKEPPQSTQQDGRYAYKANGYMSEPEPNYDSDYSTVKYRTLERRRLQSTGTGTEAAPSTAVQGDSQTDTVYGTMPNPVKSGQGSYKVQPGRIEDYVTGHSSVSEKEKKEWWDEVMDIFNGHLDQQKLSPHYTQGNLSRALLKEQGYTSDSNLVFRKKDAPPLQSPLSPIEQKQVYKSVQAGGQPPLFGFRKPAPEKPKESPNRYFESDVNIHYKTPIRYENKEPIPEEELAIRQAELMQKLYQEERRRKYLQELQDMNSRRHTDNFTPSQKSPIPLNRYDDFNSDLAPKSPNSSNYPKTVARALYNFQGQTARELTFKKGDVIYIRRQIDKNWYEGEHNAMIGLLPSNYVEIITKDGVRQPPKKPSEGQARAKYNFQAQSGIELSLNKGELVTLTRRVDDNWFEGKIANRKGIFPVSYVEVLVDIGADDRAGRTPITQSMVTQSSSVRPSLDTLRTNINNEFNSLTSNGQHPNGILKETRTLHKTEVLHVDTNTEPVAYRALYKYRPQNTDELELQEGDIVFVLEKCDDGWFVGTSQRSGCFGTFPGNYVERV